GAGVGRAGVAVAVVLSRKEGRTAARRLIARTEPMTERARKAGERVVKTATEQYPGIASKAAEKAAGMVQTVREQAPHAVETLSGVLPKFGPNGKKESAQVER